MCQRVTHRVGGFVDVLAGEQWHPGIERPVVADGFGDVQIIGAAKDKIVLAVAGRDVDEAGARVGGHEIRQQQRRVLVVAVPRSGWAQTMPFSASPL